MNRFLESVSVALLFQVLGGFAADEGPPAAKPQAARVQIQIQPAVPPGVVVGNVLPGESAPAGLGRPPMHFFPTFPFHLLPNIAAARDGKPGYLGVLLEEVAEADEAEAPAEKNKEKPSKGVGIAAVVGDSPAAKAGFAEGDRVVKFEGKEVNESAKLREFIRSAKAGQAVTLTVRRGEKQIELKPELAAAPEAAVQLAASRVPASVPGVVTFDRLTKTVQRPAADGGASDSDVVRLRDGNSFDGEIQGLDPEKGLILRRAGGQQMELLSGEIRNLAFAARENPPGGAAKVNLQLRDGGRVIGETLTMEGGVVAVTLAGGRRLEIPRQHVGSATLATGEAPQIYEGPLSLTGWSARRPGSGIWDYKDGLLRCLNNGEISRDFERLPDPLDVSFEVTYPPQIQMFTVSLFSHGTSPTTPGTLTIQLSPRSISGTHFDGKRYNRYSANPQAAGEPQEAQGSEPILSRYRLLIDRVKGRVLIYTDGIRRADWQLSRVKADEIGKAGGRFTVTPNVFSSACVFHLGRIRLLPWDGKEPGEGAGPAAPMADQIIPAGGRAVDGRVERITGREVFLEGGTAIPRDGVLFLRFGPPAAPAGEGAPVVAMVSLTDGSEFAVTEIQGEADSIRFTMGTGSQITLPLSALRAIDFLSAPGEMDAPPALADVLSLTDGTQMTGRLMTPVRDGVVRWKIAATRVPFEYATGQVAGVFFPRPGDGAGRPALEGTGIVRFANGDWLPGEVASLDGKRVVLKTGLGPELAFPLTAVRSIFLSPEVGNSVGDGSTGRELWNSGWNPVRGSAASRTAPDMRPEDLWSYHDGSYALKGTSRIGTAVLSQKWPAYSGAYALNFEFLNPARNSSFSVRLFNARGEQTLNLHSYGSRVSAYFNPGGTRRVGLGGGVKRFQIEEQTVAAEDSRRVSLVLDRPERTFRLFVNGKETGKISFRDEEAADALEVSSAIITPMSASPGRQSRIANLWRGPWEDRPVPQLEAPAERDPQAAAQPDGESARPTIHLANGDEFAGKIETLDRSLFKVDSEAGPLELPRERIAWICFPGSASAPTARFPRLRFHDRGLLAVTDLDIDTDRVKCRTLDGQALEFPLGFVKEVVWRPLD